MHELKDKVAIITGGGYGIGRQIALIYARAGAKLALAARTPGPLEEARAEVAKLGGARRRGSGGRCEGSRLRPHGRRDNKRVRPG